MSKIGKLRIPKTIGKDPDEIMIRIKKERIRKIHAKNTIRSAFF
tara:strand:- start:1373 stop:1504 length:132 start_codon:yes stop_codon:yes gene_type:complete